MLMGNFFGAVERAFIREANRIPPPRLESRTPSELPLPVPEWRRLDRRRFVTPCHYALGGAAGMLEQGCANMNLSPEFRSLHERLEITFPHCAILNRLLNWRCCNLSSDELCAPTRSFAPTSYASPVVVCSK
jgi:hypothetical protein